ncbi:MAG: helix-turn-helix transcriptional regulator [Acidimicrobiales bacterium]
MTRAAQRPVGELLREWRNRRRMSQLQLAAESAVSTRHLSFIESGRARPSREMLLHLARALEVPLREQNGLLLAAGFSPAYTESSLDAPHMAPVREALDRLLRAHDPFPALAVDRRWNLVLANASVLMLIDGIADELLQPPINVMRATLHPYGLARRIVNFEEYAQHLLDRLRRQIFLTGDETLQDLLGELVTYPGVRAGGGEEGQVSQHDVVLPVRIRDASGVLSFFSMISTLGTALDVTLADLAVESFFPADEATSRAVREGARASS